MTKPVCTVDESEYIRFIGYVDVVQNGPWVCYEWLGKKCHRGYGRFWWRGQWRQAHRMGWMWISRRGKLRTTEFEIPEEAPHLDHKCNNRACVRKEHLQPVTAKRNHELRAERYFARKQKTLGGRG